MDEGLDAAIRIDDLPDSALTAVQVGRVCRVVAAAPDYVAKHGTPDRPEALAGHRLIQSLAMETAPEWAFADNGNPLSIRLAPRLSMNTNDAVIDLALEGWGITRLLSYQVAPFVAAGRLVVLLEPFETPALPVHVIHQEGRLVSARVRAFVDFMVERLRAGDRRRIASDPYSNGDGFGPPGRRLCAKGGRRRSTWGAAAVPPRATCRSRRINRSSFATRLTRMSRRLVTEAITISRPPHGWVGARP